MKEIQIKRGTIEKFNQICRTLNNSTAGKTMQEYGEAFQGTEVFKYVPVILYMYIKMKAAKIVNGKFFIYWDRRSRDSSARNWNGFIPGENTWVADLNEHSGIMFDTDIYLNTKDYRSTYYTFRYEEGCPIDKYVSEAFYAGPTTKTLF